MKKIIFVNLFMFLTCIVFGQKESPSETKRIVSTIDSTHSPELVLTQEFTVHAPIDSVWKAYTTKEGWESWAVPVAQVELSVGGSIKTNYNPIGEIGDSTTITTHIINYVPNKLLTLQAEITDNFPEFMKAEADDFYNIITFEETENGNTKVSSYGIGYKNTAKYLQLMNFFIPANEKTLMNLIQYLEKE